VEVDLDRWVMEEWTGTRIVLIGASVIAAYFLMVALHEGGHVLGGLATGFRFQLLRIGPLMINRPFRMSFYGGPGAASNGVAQMLPVTTEKLARRAIVLVLAGPAANIVSGSIVLLLPFSKGMFSGLFILFSLANGLSDLLPIEGRLGVSDGRRIGMLVRQRELGERWLALMKLTAELAAGESFASISPDFLAKAIAVRDASADTVTAYAYAYTSAIHQNNLVRGTELLEVCLSHAAHAPPAMRDALMSDAAVFQARQKKHADLAQQWLADLPESAPPWMRTRAEAAILEAHGDLDGATRMLDAFEKRVLALPNALQRRLTLQSLQGWRAELEQRRVASAQPMASTEVLRFTDSSPRHC
jgi:hypothetical protein